MRPLLRLKARSLSCNDVAVAVRQSRRGAGYTTYEVRGGLSTSEQALSIEQEVERRLGITDVPAAGQVRDYW